MLYYSRLVPLQGVRFARAGAYSIVAPCNTSTCSSAHVLLQEATLYVYANDIFGHTYNNQTYNNRYRDIVPAFAASAVGVFTPDEIRSGIESVTAQKRMKVRSEDLKKATAIALHQADDRDYVFALQTIGGELATLAEGDDRPEKNENTKTVRGKFVTGGQKHFFLETQTCYAVPRDGGVELFCGNQDPAGTQEAIATVLGRPCNKVAVSCPRVGGAYGGKIRSHLPVATMAAVAAHKMKRPVMIHNERVDDWSHGTRLIIRLHRNFIYTFYVGFLSCTHVRDHHVSVHGRDTLYDRKCRTSEEKWRISVEEQLWGRV